MSLPCARSLLNFETFEKIDIWKEIIGGNYSSAKNQDFRDSVGLFESLLRNLDSKTELLRYIENFYIKIKIFDRFQIWNLSK